MEQQLMQMMQQGQGRPQQGNPQRRQQQGQQMDIEQLLQMLMESGASESEVMQLLQMLGGSMG